jgi:outer membrane protein TolC
MPLLILILMFLFPHQLLANDKILKEALAQIPGQKLTLDFVLKAAIKNSSSYQSLQTTKWDSESKKLGADSNYDWVLLADYNHLDQNRDTASPFEPGEIEKDTSSLGVRKSFTSGTTFEARWGNSLNSLSFNDPSIQIPSYYEDTLTFTLKQNLWADFFGISSRSNQKSDLFMSESLDHQYKINQQNWALNLVDLFHAAWLSQKKFLSSTESVQRRERLVQVTRSKLQKGTSEKQDFLQVQAAQLNSRNELSKASASLNETWRSLVITLDLPESWLSISPEKIPMQLTDISSQALQACKKPLDPSQTLDVQKAQASYLSAKESLVAAKSENSPKLELIGGYNTNGIAVTQNRSQRENWSADHPTWNVGLRFEMPIGKSATESRRLQALSQELRAQTDLDSTKDNKIIEIKTNCEKLINAQEEMKNAELAFKNQQERLELEERQFRFGRSSTFNVIQAGDDKSFSEINFYQSQIEFRKLSWRVLSSTSELYSLVESWKSSL